MKNKMNKKLMVLALFGAIALGGFTPSIAHAEGWHGGYGGGHGGYGYHGGGWGRGGWGYGGGWHTAGWGGGWGYGYRPGLYLGIGPVGVAAPVVAAPAYGYPYGYYQPYRAVVYSYPQYP